MRYKNRLSVTILQMLTFTFRLLDPRPTSTSLSAKAGCFLNTSKIPVDVCLISQQNFRLLWCPLIPHCSQFTMHPERRLPSCFKPFLSFLSALGPSYSYKRESSTPTMVKNCCAASARQTRALKLGQWTTGYVRNRCSGTFKMGNR